MASKGKYVVISPCRDEAEFMRRTLDSVIAQTIPPALWIIVDDGSTDDTPEILKEYAAKHSFIQVITRENRGFRRVGPGVVDAFYQGYNAIRPEDFEFVCKLDLDLDLPPRYFEILIDRMNGNPRLGTCSGKPYNDINGKLISEKRGDEMSVGMTKFYRMSCFIQIGGFIREVMWDAIDCHRARQLGWMVRSWDEPELRFLHLRLMGSSQHSIYVGRMRHGFGQYFMGTGPVYMVATSFYRMMHRPYVLGGLAMIWGYVRAWLSGAATLPDKDLRLFIRRYQWLCLFRGKRIATALMDARRRPFWDIHREPLPMPIARS